MFCSHILHAIEVFCCSHNFFLCNSLFVEEADVNHRILMQIFQMQIVELLSYLSKSLLSREGIIC
jgi:hypothetical protein